MLCKVIATPCDTGTGAWKGWTFTPDNGRALNAGEVRFTYNPRCKKRIKKILTHALHEYNKGIDEYWSLYKKSKQSQEYTQSMRARKAERDKFLREGRELKYIGI